MTKKKTILKRKRRISRIKKKSIKHAKQLELKASHLESLRNSGKDISTKKISGFYELAGDIQTGYDPYQAIHDYHDALHYAITNKDMYRIQAKIGETRRSIYSFKGKHLIILSFVSFILSLFFLSFNITGNAIVNIKKDFSILGILFFILGLSLTFFYARSKR